LERAGRRLDWLNRDRNPTGALMAERLSFQQSYSFRQTPELGGPSVQRLLQKLASKLLDRPTRIGRCRRL